MQASCVGDMKKGDLSKFVDAAVRAEVLRRTVKEGQAQNADLMKTRRWNGRTKPWRGYVQILFDTNVMISGFLSSKGLPGQLLQEGLDGRFDLITSQTQLAVIAAFTAIV